MHLLYEIFYEELELLLHDDIVEFDSGNNDPELHYRSQVYVITDSGITRIRRWIRKAGKKAQRPPK